MLIKELLFEIDGRPFDVLPDLRLDPDKVRKYLGVKTVSSAISIKLTSDLKNIIQKFIIGNQTFRFTGDDEEKEELLDELNFLVSNINFGITYFAEEAEKIEKINQAFKDQTNFSNWFSILKNSQSEQKHLFSNPRIKVALQQSPEKITKAITDKNSLKELINKLFLTLETKDDKGIVSSVEGFYGLLYLILKHISEMQKVLH